MHTINIRVTHQKADIPTLEAVAFPDVKKALIDIHNISSVKEALIMQTCNRMEIFIGVEDIDVGYHDVIDYFMKATMSKMRNMQAGAAESMPMDQLLTHVIDKGARFHDVIESEFHSEALHHLLRLSSGLESMIVGEDQILGQIRESLNMAQSANTVGPFFKTIFTKAIHVGQAVRKKTKINEGAVSIGSAAVELASSALGSLEGRDVLLIGAGEMGTLIAKSLCEYSPEKTMVANRTYEKGVEVAQELGGEAIKFEDLAKGIKDSEVVITATGAKEPVVTPEMVKGLMEGREKKDLVFIDVAIPRDVDEKVGSIGGVTVFNIDGLREIAEKNKQAREIESIKVEEIIEDELSLLTKQLYQIDVEDIVKGIFSGAEEVRQKELEKALRMMGSGICDRDRQIVDDLTRVIVGRTMAPLADEIRKAAETHDHEALDVAQRWFIKEGRKKR